MLENDLPGYSVRRNNGPSGKPRVRTGYAVLFFQEIGPYLTALKYMIEGIEPTRKYGRWAYRLQAPTAKPFRARMMS